jgi:hypothetical protein
LRADILGTYPNFFDASITRFLVASEILIAPGLLFKISEAVVRDTAASFAMSLIVTRVSSPL